MRPLRGCIVRGWRESGGHRMDFFGRSLAHYRRRRAIVRWKRATPRFGHCKRNHPQGWRGKMCFVPVGTHRQWRAVWIFRCISQASYIYPPDLRFWEFWKPIEDRKFSWCSFPSVTLIHLPFTWTLMDPGCACLQAYGEFSSFCTHVADHLWKLFINHIPNSGFWNPTLQQSHLKANFFLEGFPKSFRRNWPLSLLNSSLHSSSLWQPHSGSSWDPVFSCYYMCVHSVTRLCQLFVTPWTVAH